MILSFMVPSPRKPLLAPSCKHSVETPAALCRLPVSLVGDPAARRWCGTGVRASALAQTIVAAAESRGIAIPDVTDFDSPTGKGALGTVEGKFIVLGNESFLAEHGVDATAFAAQADSMRGEGATAIYIGVAGKVAGILAIADPVKPTTVTALNALRQDGIRVVMLTGDNGTTAMAVARHLGIDDVEADVLPDEKSAVVSRLKSEGRVVAMAGDGVNDAPALAAADVGIAMGLGTDVAMESAGVTLLKGDLMGIVKARHLSEATMRNIRQNLFFAFVYNAAGIPVAAGVLYPAFGLLLSPIIAAAAMTLSSVTVIANALRLRALRLLNRALAYRCHWRDAACGWRGVWIRDGFAFLA